MYKILIVDDEAVVREGIRDNMEWGEMGFEFAGDCENGSEAMSAVDRIQPDVVLTDICMPFVDGLELTKYIMDKHPNTRVVLLTGYDEFEYAQKAIKLKAYDYILKPVTARELQSKLEKLREELDEEKRNREDISKLKKQLKESLPLLKERFLNRVISGNLLESITFDKLEYFNIHLAGDHYASAMIDIDDYSEMGSAHPGAGDELLLFAVFNISEEIVGNYNSGVVFQNNNNKTVIIFVGNNTEELQEKAAFISDEIRAAIQKYLKFTVTIGVGNVCSDLKDISESYKGAVSAVDYRFLLGSNRVISINDMEVGTSSPSPYNRELVRKLVSGIKTGTVQEVDEIISKVIDSLKQSYTSIEGCYIHIQHMLISVIDALNELGFSDAEIFEGDTSPLTSVYRLKTLDEVERWLRVFCKKASSTISDKRDDYWRLQALKAEEYIKANYMDENISLNAICKHLLMSTSYFSMIFKNFTGDTFIEYLTKVRVEKAMELLKGTSLKSYEVAHKVGYSDPHYFGLIFKKATGMTPIEYRERM